MVTKKSKRERHILALSGGKDSAALAVYLKDKIPDLEYVFCDTGHELPETYDYLYRMESLLRIRVMRIRSDRSFENWLEYKNHYLPSQERRWCTVELKIRPFEKYVGNDLAYSYIGLRADEDREGYFSNKENIKPRYPFIANDLVYSDIQNLLESSGLGFPSYYEWRSRSGCYFCFFQQKIEWLNLYEHHKKLFHKAMAFEKPGFNQGERFTWCSDMSLGELLGQSDKIRANHKERVELENKKRKKNAKLCETLSEYNGCLICTI